MAITNPLNSEAGQVPVPSDPIEIAAAVRANRIMWRAFPYLGFRYGERGKRFGNSDSASLSARVPRTRQSSQPGPR